MTPWAYSGAWVDEPAPRCDAVLIWPDGNGEIFVAQGCSVFFAHLPSVRACGEVDTVKGVFFVYTHSHMTISNERALKIVNESLLAAPPLRARGNGRIDDE